MNKKLIDICININADILFLAKAEKIDKETIQIIKKKLPNIKIMQWYVDHLEEDEEFFSKLELIDVFYYANAKNLQELSKTYTIQLFHFSQMFQILPLIRIST